MAVNKVDVNGATVLDLTQASVTPATLKKGETAHDASGAAIVGEMESSAPSLQSKSVTYTANGTATITPDDGYDGLSSVDVTVDVSGGGGSSEYEECTVQFKGKIYSGGSIVWATLRNGTIQIVNQVFNSTITLNNFSSLRALKNCLFIVNNGNETFSVEGNVSYINTTEYGYVPFFVKGDCKINFS